MQNPFEELSERLDRIEKLLLTLQGQGVKSDTPVIEQPITQKELCAFLKITEPTILRWRKKGKIPFLQIGTAVRFNLSAVLKALGK